MTKYTLRISGNQIRFGYLDANEDCVQSETFKRVPGLISEYWMAYTSMRGDSSASFTEINMSREETLEYISKNWLPKMPFSDQMKIKQFFHFETK